VLFLQKSEELKMSPRRIFWIWHRVSIRGTPLKKMT